MFHPSCQSGHFIPWTVLNSSMFLERSRRNCLHVFSQHFCVAPHCSHDKVWHMGFDAFVIWSLLTPPFVLCLSPHPTTPPLYYSIHIDSYCLYSRCIINLLCKWKSTCPAPSSDFLKLPSLSSSSLLAKLVSRAFSFGHYSWSVTFENLFHMLILLQWSTLFCLQSKFVY